MTGERDLVKLLAGMTPILRDGVFVFATLPPGAPAPDGLDAVMIFREAEGPTLIVDRDRARRAGLEFAFPSRMITLEIHSALAAVGFLAAVTERLAAAGLPVNPVSGFHHDHLFVPESRAEEALAILRSMALG